MKYSNSGRLDESYFRCQLICGSFREFWGFCILLIRGEALLFVYLTTLFGVPLWDALPKQTTFVVTSSVITSSFSVFLSSPLSLIFSCPCAVFLLCSFICGLSLILFWVFLFLLFFLLSFIPPFPSSFSGDVDENRAYFIFCFRGRWIFKFCIFALFLCSPSFFPVALWCVCGFVIILFGWAHRRGCAGSTVHMCTHTLLTPCLFIPETRGAQRQAMISVCLKSFIQPQLCRYTFQTLWSHIYKKEIT